ncbi:MAG: hypothetical protein L3K26_13570, partial [Candidatus Hydrogenedentes bacterium]|nr:hypothetical protein [Candidatus Hydrogenedentota bacterium]
PGLVLHSQGDEAASPDASAEAYGHIASTDKQMLWYTERSNHHLLWDYDAEDVVAKIVQFLGQPDSVKQEG